MDRERDKEMTLSDAARTVRQSLIQDKGLELGRKIADNTGYIFTS